MKPKLLSVGDRVEEGTCTLHARFRRSVNFTSRGRLVSLVDHEIGAGPVNIVFDGLDLEKVKTLEVTGDSVHVNGIAFSISTAQVYDSSMDFCRGRRIPNANILWLKYLLTAQAPEKSMAFLLHSGRRGSFRPGFESTMRDQLQLGSDLLISGQVQQGIQKLHGCGLGLTPSGDDFIAGLLIALHTAGDRSRPLRDEIYRHAGGGSLLVASFLGLAHEGRVNELMRSLLESLINKGQDEITNAADSLFAVGATSGADLCTGLYMGLDRGP